MSEDKKRTELGKMTTDSVWKLVFLLSVPTVLSMLISSVYNTADTFFVSKLGDSATGAVGIVFSLQSIIQAFGYGIGMGCGSLVSRSLGAGDREGANRYASSAVAAAAAVGIVIGSIGLLATDPMLRMFGSTETILPNARGYARYILIGAPIMCVSFTLNNILRAEGHATFSMIGLTVGGLINMALDPFYIFTLGYGVKGAAMATVLSQFISFTILLCFFLMQKSCITLSVRFISRKLSDYLLIIRTGIPTVFRQGLGSIATTLLNIQAAAFGDPAIAAVSIASKVYMLLRSLLIGVGQGFQPVAGYNYGAKKYSRVKKAFLVATVIGSTISSASALVILLFPTQVMEFFNPESQTTVDFGVRMLRFLGLSLPVLAYSTFVNQLYQSLGYVKGATFLASCRQGIFFIPLILILPRVMGETGIQITQAAADLLTFAVSVPFRVYFFRRLPREDGAELHARAELNKKN